MIERDPARAASDSYDLIIVGGGIYGVCLAFEASRRGLKSLLLERDDFGGATSWNSLRIIHGGLRYLQTLDLVRFRESVLERRWFLRHFPDLVRPLRCLMPLYGRGMKRPRILRAALCVNDLLSIDRNRGVQADHWLSPGEILDVEQTVIAFPHVERAGLKGAGAWWDAVMLCPQRVLMEFLRSACADGAVAHNYVEATSLVIHRGRVEGMRAVDRVTGHNCEFTAPHVINCAGPWSRALAADVDRDYPALFRPSLAFNVLMDVEAPSESAVAVAPRSTGEPVYFAYATRNGVLAGTAHAPWRGGADDLHVSEAGIQTFLDELNDAIPGLGLTLSHVKRVFAGLLPATRDGGDKLTKRPAFVDHGRRVGPRGLFSVAGIKYTTARRVAEHVLNQIAPESTARPVDRQPSEWPVDLIDAQGCVSSRHTDLEITLQRLVREESVQTIDDLIYRRTGWGDDPTEVDRVTARIRAVAPELPSQPTVAVCNNEKLHVLHSE